MCFNRGEVISALFFIILSAATLSSAQSQRIGLTSSLTFIVVSLVIQTLVCKGLTIAAIIVFCSAASTLLLWQVCIYCLALVLEPAPKLES